MMRVALRRLWGAALVWNAAAVGSGVAYWLWLRAALDERLTCALEMERHLGARDYAGCHVRLAVPPQIIADGVALLVLAGAALLLVAIAASIARAARLRASARRA